MAKENTIDNKNPIQGRDSSNGFAIGRENLASRRVRRENFATDAK